MKKIKVCAYCRVSTNSEDQRNSFENQVGFFQREISFNPDYIFDKNKDVYADKGLTGTKFENRPNFIKMLENCGLDIEIRYNKDKDKRKEYIEYTFIPSSSRESMYDLILIKSTSRFARNILAIGIIRKLLMKNVYIHFLDRDLNTKNGKDMDILNKMFDDDEGESKTKSRIVKWGIDEGIRNGVLHTNGKLYGYKFIKKGNKKESSLEIIEKEAEVIRKIFDLYSKNKGIRQIRNQLEIDGYKTREGNCFGNTTIRRILQNEKYCGMDNRGKYDTGVILQNKHYPKPRENYRIKPCDKIPKIVSPELFDMCKEIMQGKINYQNQKGVYKGFTKYSGLIYCAKCNSTYISNIDRGREFYNCSTKKRYGIKYCDNINLYVKDIQKVINHLCNEGYYDFFSQDRAFYIEEINKRIFELEGNINKDNKKLVGELEKQKQVYIDRMQLTVNQLTNITSQVAIDMINKSIKDLDNNIKEIEAQIEYYSLSNNEIYEKIRKEKRFIDSLYNMKLKINYSPDEMIGLIEKIVVRKGNPDIKGENENKPVLLVYFKGIGIQRKIIPDNVS
jgi:hypothetical protein